MGRPWLKGYTPQFGMFGHPRPKSWLDK